MLFKSDLGNLEQKIFFVTQPWQEPFNINFPVIFVIKTHESFLQSSFKLCYHFKKNFPLKTSRSCKWSILKINLLNYDTNKRVTQMIEVLCTNSSIPYGPFKNYITRVGGRGDNQNQGQSVTCGGESYMQIVTSPPKK